MIHSFTVIQKLERFRISTIKKWSKSSTWAIKDFWAMFLEQFFANFSQNQFSITLVTVSSQSYNTWKSVKSINWAPARHRVILHQKYYLFEKEMQNSWTLWNREKIHIFVQWSYSSNIYNWGGISWFYTYGQNICNFLKKSEHGI